MKEHVEATCLILTDAPGKLDSTKIEAAIKTRFGRLKDAVKPSQLKETWAVAVIIQPEDDIASFLDGDVFASLDGLPIVLVASKPSDVNLNDKVLENGLFAWLEYPCETDHLIAALKQALHGSVADTKFIGVVGAGPGVGGTSVAISLADALTQTNSSRRVRVALIDLDFSTGGCGRRLDLVRNVDIETFIQSPERVDFGFLESASARLGHEIFLLSVEHRALVTDTKGSEFVLRCLDSAIGHFDYVVLDMPYYASPWFDDVVQNVDMIVLTALNNVESVGNCLAMKIHIEKMRTSTPNDVIFVNRVRKRFALFSSSATLYQEVFPGVGKVIGWSDTYTMTNAEKSSRLPHDISRRSPFAESVFALARLVQAKLNGAA